MCARHVLLQHLQQAGLPTMFSQHQQPCVHMAAMYTCLQACGPLSPSSLLRSERSFHRPWMQLSSEHCRKAGDGTPVQPLHIARAEYGHAGGNLGGKNLWSGAPNTYIVSSLSHTDPAVSRMSAEQMEAAAVINDRRWATLLRSQSLLRRLFYERACVVKIHLRRRQATCLCEGWNHSDAGFQGKDGS